MHQDNFTFFSFLCMLGGLSVFLLGLELMSEHLRKSSGATLKLILAQATQNKYVGVLVGILVTAVIQSSSATTSILVSLVQSQLLNFQKTVAVIMGANIGTTITGQIIAFKITHWALPIIFVGFLIQTLARTSQGKHIGYIILGLGMLFFGLGIMSDAMHPLRSSEFFRTLMLSLENIPLGILIGAVFTALVQSSSASLGIMIGMASQGLVTVEAAIPIIMGANLGTCITAVLAALKSSSEAKRVAAAHILFNTGGVLLFCWWIPKFTEIIESFTPNGDIVRVIANAQTAFNVLATLIWLPFSDQLQRLAEVLVPESKAEKRLRNKKYTLPDIRSFSLSPEIAFIQSRKASQVLKNIVKEMLIISRSYLLQRNKDIVTKFEDLRNDQRQLSQGLLELLTKLSREQLSSKDTKEILRQSSVINELERLANELELTMDRIAVLNPNHEENFAELDKYFKQSTRLFSQSINAFVNDSNKDAANCMRRLKKQEEFEDEFRNQCLTEIASKSSTKNSYQQSLLLVLETLRSVNTASKRVLEKVL